MRLVPLDHPCSAQQLGPRRRIVLTGGPGAGKTAVLELVRRAFCSHVDVLPEAASILFLGGFPRAPSVLGRQAAQRAIFRVQRELETVADERAPAIVLCDRGTADGLAYWPGEGDFWAEMGTTRAAEHERYSAVIHLRTPTDGNGYNHQNPARIETAKQAEVIDERIVEAWDGHPRRFVVESSLDFFSKARRAIEILKGEMPECCRQHFGATP